MMSSDRLNMGVQSDLSIFAGTMVEMTWEEVQKSAENGDIVLFPIGVVEEHGPHMDLSPDVYMAYLFCEFLKQNLAMKKIHSIIAPPYYWGISEPVKKYPGSFSVRPETMKAMLADIFNSLHSWGFSNVFVVNAHGDKLHKKVIDETIQETNETTGLHVYNLSNLDVPLDNPPVFPPPREGRFKPDYHAGAIETAAMYAFYPPKVNVERAKQLKPQSSFDPLGYCGDPASFLLEKTIIECWRGDLETDSLKIEAILQRGSG